MPSPASQSEIPDHHVIPVSADPEEQHHSESSPEQPSLLGNGIGTAGVLDHAPPYSDSPVAGVLPRPSSDSSQDSIALDGDQRPGRDAITWPFADRRHTSRSQARRRTWKATWEWGWRRNKGVVLVALSQFFGALMNVATRLLETDGGGMHPLQILFARMSITIVLSCLYMWYTKVPHFPFGDGKVRGLLVARGMAGFFGVYGLYYSLLYLPISEATVLTFIAPIIACWACSIILKESFTRMEQIAGLVSLLGVILIARPVTLFSKSEANTVAAGDSDTIPAMNGTQHAGGAYSLDDVTPAQRLSAVGVAMVGVGGAACAYTTIRWIGKRAHPLISVNYFATWCTIVSTSCLIFIPEIGFQLPSSARQWAYLFALGVCGFIMQFLLTAGLAHEKSSRATNMVYTQMLFALAFDKLIWGITPVAISMVGGSLILGAAIYVAVLRDSGKGNSASKTGKAAARADEEQGLVEGMEGEDDVSEGERSQGRGPLRDIHEVQLRTIRV